MTDKQINAAIAVACGWTDVTASHRSGKTPGADYVGYEFYPNYSTDLNAMHEAERTILDMNDGYGWELSRTECFTVWHATARQRAEAFLRLLDKWEEGE